MPGIGPRRRRTLLTTFGSLAGVRRATREELAGDRRRKSRRCRPCVFRESALTCYSVDAQLLLRLQVCLSQKPRVKPKATVFCEALLDINFAQVFIAFTVLLFSLTVHEMAHAWTADRLGDPTARLLGRVSLNPIVHADPIGTVLFPLLALIGGVPLIGWAKPVPVVISRLRHQRRDYVLVAAAGPASNLVLAVVASLHPRGCCRSRRSTLGEPNVSAAARGAFCAWPSASTCCWPCSTCCRFRRSTAATC